MAVCFKYWDDCVEAVDMEAMWMDHEVSAEWLNAGETRGQKVHLSRDPDGQPYLTQTEMRAVVAIVVRRHFASRMDQDMICAIAELESDRQPLAMRYDKKTKETTVGIMQLLPKTANWLASELDYRAYDVEGNPDLLFRPFISVYFGAAYLKWLSNYEEKERSEEFVVRAYKGGTKKATRKVTLPYWRRYLSVKESLPARKVVQDAPSIPDASASPAPNSPTTGVAYTYWDSKVSPQDMEDMWNHPSIVKEWTKSGERRGKVRFSHDEEKRPYLSRVEVKAIAEIILRRYFSAKAVIKPRYLCTMAEIAGKRFVNGVAPRIGIMGIDYPTADWLYKELGYKAYNVESADDLTKPFVSMYFGTAYLVWLSEYEGRERTPEFVVQAYFVGPDNVNLQETGQHWLTFQEALSLYRDSRREHGSSCSIL